MLRPPFDWRHPIRSLAGDHPRRMPSRSNDSSATPCHGYDPGEHCLGGGYVLSRTLLDRAAAAGYLNDPLTWMEIDLAEDVMAGVIVRAVGLGLANHVTPGEVFGVRWPGLPAPPAVLVRAGLRRDPRGEERPRLRRGDRPRLLPGPPRRRPPPG